MFDTNCQIAFFLGGGDGVGQGVERSKDITKILIFQSILQRRGY